MANLDNDAQIKKRVDIPVIPNMPLDGVRLTLNDLDKLPKSIDFTIPEMRDMVDASLSNNKDIMFFGIKMMTYKWSDPSKFGWKFRLLWRGMLEDGRAALLIVANVYPTMYVRMPQGMEENQFISAVKQSVVDFELAATPTIIMGKRLVYFEKDKHPFVKIECINLDVYKDVRNKFTEIHRWIVADTRYPLDRFYKQANRMYKIAPAGWNKIKYTQRGNPYPKNIVSDIDEVLVVSIHDIIAVDVSEIQNPRPSLVMPHMTDLDFDIETGSRQIGNALKADRDDTHCNMNVLTLRVNKKDLWRILFTTSEHVMPFEGATLFLCKNEVEMFIVMANVIRRIRPCLTSGYNIDDFDWRFIITKIIKAGMAMPFFSAMDMVIQDFSWWRKKNSNESSIAYNEFIARQYVKNGNMKISADERNAPIYFPNIISFQNIDFFSQLKRKHVSGKFSRKSLNYFLEYYGLPLKYDMDYPEMHRIYNMQIDIADGKIEVTDEYIRLINEMAIYNVFDTIAQQDLADASAIRESAFISARQNQCTLHDVLYYANGGVVIEKFITSAFHKGYFDCNEKPIEEQKGTYDGALVLHPPVRGISKPKMNARERKERDPSWYIVDDDEIVLIEEAHLNSIDDPVPYLISKNMRPAVLELVAKMVNEGHETPTIPFDFNSMYPNIMAEGNLSLEKAIKAGEEEMMRRVGIKTRVVDRTLSSGMRIYCEFQVDDGDKSTRGLIPAEQNRLLQMRNEKKRALKEATAVLEQIDKDNRPADWTVQRAKCDILNMEQLECKISMNTYYGKAGDRTNALFMMAIACDTTLTGREILRELVGILDSHGWAVRYGDTDSAYAQAPWVKYKDIIARYYGGKLSLRDYYEEIILRAHKIADDMEKIINETLNDNNHPFMRVAKERVGFPDIRIRCKRYVMGNHINPKKSSINEDGSCAKYCVGVSKKTASGVSTMLSDWMQSKLLNIYDKDGVELIARKIVAESFRRARDHEWDLKLFIRRSQYKPEKNNISVINFLKRLKDEGKVVPRPYEKFEYVFVKRDDIEYDVYGNKNDISSSNFMELYSDVVEKKLPIDFMKYMTGEIIGELGQYICCDPKFMVHAVDSSDSARLAAEDATTLNGVNFITMLCKQAAGTLDTKMTKPIYSKIFDRIKTKIVVHSKSKNIKSDKINMIMAAEKQKVGIINMFDNIIDKQANAGKKSLVNAMISSIKSNFNEVVRCYGIENSKNSCRRIYIEAISLQRDTHRARLIALCDIIDTFCKSYNGYIKSQSDALRNHLGLLKSVIDVSDIENAMKMVNNCDIDDISFDAPDPDIFDECDTLVEKLTAYETHIRAFDDFHTEIKNMIEEYGHNGRSIDPASIASDIARATSKITFPDSVYEM